MSKDTIYRQAAIDIERRATVDTNPEHFESHQKFVEFMDDAEISSFGRWQWSNGFNTALTAVGIDLKRLPAAETEGYVKIPDTGIGDLSDGYHTFNGLYEQRMILFEALVKAYKGRAWKSYRHEDGELCFGGGWFIVGIDTPEGSYTYHYENKYWDLFDCTAISRGKHWDGHTEEDAKTRLLSLPPTVLESQHGRLIDGDEFECLLNNSVLLIETIIAGLNLEDDEGWQRELKAYRDILEGVREAPTVVASTKGEYVNAEMEYENA